jgi:hypothetical protein
MQQETTPVLDYTSQRPRLTSVAWQSIVAGVGGFIFIPSFMCTCGHLGRDALLATVAILVLSWWGFLRRLSVIGRVLAIAVAALVSVAFVKNLLDIGWFGHDPLFK